MRRRTAKGASRGPGRTNSGPSPTGAPDRRPKRPAPARNGPCRSTATRCATSKAGQIVASYAHPAFEVDSYQQMRGAACLKPTDCWFGGEPLPEPQIGAFQLHWNGSALEAEPYLGEGFPVRDMLAFEGHIYQSVRVEIPPDRTEHSEAITIPVLHLINPPGAIPAFEPEDEAGAGLPFYEEEELPQDLDYFHLSAADGVAVGRRGPAALLRPAHGGGARRRQLAAGDRPPVARRRAARTHPAARRPRRRTGAGRQFAQPGESDRDRRRTRRPAASGSVSSTPNPRTRRCSLHINAQGEQLSERILPERRRNAPKASATRAPWRRLACPQPGDCWMATSKGWLFHLAPAVRTHARPQRRPRLRTPDLLSPARPGAAPGPARTLRLPTSRAFTNRASPKSARSRKPRRRRNRWSRCRCSRTCTAAAQGLQAAAELPPVGEGARAARRPAQASGRGRRPRCTPSAAGNRKLAAAAEPAPLADEAEPPDEGARAAAPRLVGHRRRSQGHDRDDRAVRLAAAASGGSPRGPLP